MIARRALRVLCLLLLLVVVGCGARGGGQQPSVATQTGGQSGGPTGGTATAAGGAPAAQLVQTPEEPASSWFADADFLAAFASLGALVISIAALFISQTSAKEQRIREKREELRGVVEKLVSLREEFNNKINGILDAQERQNFSVSTKTKVAIYLQAAEALAEDIVEHVSSAEFYVLGVENHWDSDFRQARKYYAESIRASDREASVINQSLARRTLASSYFYHEPRDRAEGRRLFAEAIKVLEERDEGDFYSMYTEALTYRNWAWHETWHGSKEEARRRLAEALQAAQKLPDWYPLKLEEIRYIANEWRGLGSSHFQTSVGTPIDSPDMASARQAYEKGFEVLQQYVDDNTIDLRGQFHQDWGYNEMLYGSQEEGARHFLLAREQYMRLSPNYPPRELRLRMLEMSLSMLRDRLGQPAQTTDGRTPVMTGPAGEVGGMTPPGNPPMSLPPDPTGLTSGPKA